MAPAAPQPPLVEVSAGLVFREGRLLLTRRQPGTHLAGLWEFPGGKREAAETFEQCLHRELREELGIEVRILSLLESLTHQYPEKAVHLRFFHCQWTRHEPRPLGCPEFRWITPGELNDYSFPAADAHLLHRLKSNRKWWI